MDQQKAEAFAGRMFETIIGGTVTSLIGVGDALRLWDTLAALPPSTAADVAKAAGLNERYVREWLDGVTVASIVEYDPASKTYSLPPEHAASLTTAAGTGNLGVFAHYVPYVGSVFFEVLDAFKTGAGVPYSAYRGFQALQQRESTPLYDELLVEGMLPLIPGMSERLQAGADVLDFGCGCGHAVNVMAKAFPNSRFTGIDLSEEGIDAARKEAAELGLTNATFEVRNAEDANGPYDMITAFDAVHDLAQPDRILRIIHDRLKPDGVFFAMDMAASSHVQNNIGNPMASVLYFFSVMHCMSVSLAQGGVGLGTAWGEEKAAELFAQAGFTDVKADHLDADPLHVYYVARP